jgi:hypothetical protein
LLLRVVVGGTMFSHGAQKLFVALAISAVTLTVLHRRERLREILA